MRAANLIRSSRPAFAAFGVNISGPEFPTTNANYGWPTVLSWNYLRACGVKIVRIAIAWENIQPTLSGSLDPTFLNLLKNACLQASYRGMGVIVDLHNFGAYADSSKWGSTVNYAGNGGTAATGVNFLGDGTLTTTVFADPWTRISTALKGLPGVIGYDLMNEPSTNIVGANLIVSPNYLGDQIGSQIWNTTNGCVVTQLGAGTNPIAGYGPAWSITSGTGFGSVAKFITLAAVPYSLSCDAKVASGTDTNFFLEIGPSNTPVTVTTSWQRFKLENVTPTAGSVEIQLQVNEAAGHTIQVANVDLRLGATAATDLTYEPSPWSPFAQAAITAIRAIDSATPIYVAGTAGSGASTWPRRSYEMALLTGGNLVFEAHQYFDGAAGVGGGGTYTGNFASYSITSTAGVTDIQPYLDWLSTTGVKGFLGEFGIPNTTSDAQSWTPLMQNVESALQNVGVNGCYWFYAGAGFQDSAKLNIAPAGNSNHPSPHIAALIGPRA